MIVLPSLERFASDLSLDKISWSPAADGLLEALSALTGRHRICIKYFEGLQKRPIEKSFFLESSWNKIKIGVCAFIWNVIFP